MTRVKNGDWGGTHSILSDCPPARPNALRDGRWHVLCPGHRRGMDEPVDISSLVGNILYKSLQAEVWFAACDPQAAKILAAQAGCRGQLVHCGRIVD